MSKVAWDKELWSTTTEEVSRWGTPNGTEARIKFLYELHAMNFGRDPVIAMWQDLEYIDSLVARLSPGIFSSLCPIFSIELQKMHTVVYQYHMKFPLSHESQRYQKKSFRLLSSTVPGSAESRIRLRVAICQHVAQKSTQWCQLIFFWNYAGVTRTFDSWYRILGPRLRHPGHEVWSNISCTW